MRKLIFVHGINNEDQTPNDISKSWSDALKTQLSTADKTWWDSVEFSTAYYADVLHAEAEKWGQSTDNPTRMSVDSPDEDYADDDVASLYFELQQAYGIDDETVAAELDEDDDRAAARRMAAGIHKKWLKAIARALEKVIPSAGNGLAKLFLTQAATYLSKPGVFDEINSLVNDQIFLDIEDNSKTVIVAHSLGTVVSYVLLRRLRNVDNFPLFMTVGSPLGIGIVKDRIRGSMFKPEVIDNWTNGSDPEDFVALHSALNENTFGPAKIKNIIDVENGPDDAHSIEGYLSNRRIAREILDALS